jgi:diguanylate cyclase (GGDEF)-like protein/PAS domain S-box-containing protein
VQTHVDRPEIVITAADLLWEPEAAPAVVQAVDGLLATGYDAVVVQDPSGQIVASNERACELLGLTREQLLGRTSMDPRWAACADDGSPLPGEQHPAMVALRTGRRTEAVLGVDAPGPDDRGRFVWLEVDATPVRGPSGDVLASVAQFRDVSHTAVGEAATRRVIRALRDSAASAADREARFRLVAEHASDLVVRTDSSGRCEWVSPSVIEVLGWGVDQVAGAALSAFVHPDDLGSLVCRPGSENVTERRILRLRTVDGRWRSMDTHSRALEEDDGTGAACLLSMRDVTATLERQEELEYLAAHDTLTGLVNRDGILRHLAASLERLGGGRLVGLLFVDVDRFKEVNDSHGHLAGDRLLQQVAHRMTASLRETDIVARVGGDEFVAVLPGLADAVIAERRAEAVIEALRGRSPAGIPSASVSIGLAVASDPSTAAEALLVHADEALYRAKESGRDRWSW